MKSAQVADAPAVQDQRRRLARMQYRHLGGRPARQLAQVKKVEQRFNQAFAVKEVHRRRLGLAQSITRPRSVEQRRDTLPLARLPGRIDGESLTQMITGET